MTLTEEVQTRRSLPAPELARSIRISAGITQERLATEIGVTRMTVGRWEAGKRQPRGRLLLDYIKVLNELKDVA
jgi:DNA-binding XRE family transcriptional regulator